MQGHSGVVLELAFAAALRAWADVFPLSAERHCKQRLYEWA